MIVNNEISLGRGIRASAALAVEWLLKHHRTLKRDAMRRF